MTVRAPGDARYLATAIVAWTGAGLLGFLAARALPGTGPQGRALGWTLGLPLAALAGSAIERTLRARLAPSAAATHALEAGVLWALSSAAGWGIDVRVGGPLSGLATAFLLDAPAATSVPAWRRAAIGGLVAGGVLMLVAPPDVRGSWLAALAAVLAVSLPLLARAGVVVTRAGPMIIVWAAAWVAAYTVTGRVALPDLAGYGGTGAEVVLAYVLGAAGTWIVARAGGPAAALAAAGLLATAIGIGADVALRAARAAVAGPDGWRHFHLALTQTLGMGVAAIAVATLTARSAARVAAKRPQHEVRGGA